MPHLPAISAAMPTPDWPRGAIVRRSPGAARGTRGGASEPGRSEPTPLSFPRLHRRVQPYAAAPGPETGRIIDVYV